MPGTVSELFPRRPCSLPGYDSQSTPHLLLPSPPRVLHSPIIRHSSCIFPSSASLTSPSSPVSNPPLSPRTATLSLSSPPTPPPHFLFLFLCSHHHPLSPSRLACKLPFPLLSQLLLLLPSLSSSYSLSGQCRVISSFQAGNWLWKTARTWLNAPSAPQPTTHIHTST